MYATHRKMLHINVVTYLNIVNISSWSLIDITFDVKRETRFKWGRGGVGGEY